MLCFRSWPAVLSALLGNLLFQEGNGIGNKTVPFCMGAQSTYELMELERGRNTGLIRFWKGTSIFQAITVSKVVVHLCGWGLGDSSKEPWAHLLLGSAPPFLPQFAFPLDHFHLSTKLQGEKKNQVNFWNISLWLICDTEINCKQCTVTPQKHSGEMNRKHEIEEAPHINRCICTRLFFQDLLEVKTMLK